MESSRGNLACISLANVSHDLRERERFRGLLGCLHLAAPKSQT